MVTYLVVMTGRGYTAIMIETGPAAGTFAAIVDPPAHSCRPSDRYRTSEHRSNGWSIDPHFFEMPDRRQSCSECLHKAALGVGAAYLNSNLESARGYEVRPLIYRHHTCRNVNDGNDLRAESRGLTIKTTGGMATQQYTP
jgi:hypothetical protein